MDTSIPQGTATLLLRLLLPLVVAGFAPCFGLAPETSRAQGIRPHGVVWRCTNSSSRGTLPESSSEQATSAHARVEGQQRKSAKAASGYASTVIANTQHGPVMSNPISVYIVWVGKIGNPQKKLVRNFIASLNPTSDPSVTVDNWWAINTRYYGGRLTGSTPTGGFVSKFVNLKGEYEYATRVRTIGDVFSFVQQGIGARNWPLDQDAVYAVITAKGITQKGVPGFPQQQSCVQYCGWHYYSNYNGRLLKYLWTGLPACTGCGSYSFQSNGGSYVAPSLNSWIHEAISTFAHELAETASDPYLSSWYDTSGNENADLCLMSYGGLSYFRRGRGVAVANLVGLGGSKYLVQQNMDPISGTCVSGV